MKRLSVAARILKLICVSMLFTVAAQAENRWVTDEFEIMMRTGKSNKQRIVRQLPSGTRVDVLENDAESGFSRVKLGDGLEGWVLTRYLRSQPTAGLLLPDVQQKLDQSQKVQADLRQQLGELRGEKQSLQRQVNELQAANNSLQDELDRITRLSSSTIEVDDQNRQLKQRLADSQQQIDLLATENNRLASRSDREWFLVGGAVMLLGLLLGLIIPRLKLRKKSSWSDF